nr:WecB/TagA/CpsF family glycosyltransferase [uncultured Prevotella sp.]
MFRLKTLTILGSKAELSTLPEGKLLINTINAHSYNTALKDPLFAEALSCGDVLIPDGVSIVKACRWIGAKSQPRERIAGWDLFDYEMNRLERESEASTAKGESPKTVMFMGSSQKVLDLIVKRAAEVYPHLKVATYSPPYKPEFTDEDNRAIITAIHASNPDLLWIGMTAPKQEKWTYSHWSELDIHCHVGTIGAVFDFFAGRQHPLPQEHVDRETLQITLGSNPQPPQASIKHQASTQHEQQASCKQPFSKSLSESGFIPAQKTAALLLAKTSDGPPTIE